ncbi:MAG: DNA/RNA nuclease SfsA, partial [Alphaproteobacteria bacterium]|nr:DNA/RNA nuclease SfsA [Alphaproteobacteria bacterium]
MKFPSPLLKATLIKRYKRFLADVTLGDGSIDTAHSVNTGAMTGVTDAGNSVWLSTSTNPKRKLKYTWEFVEAV